MINSMTGYACYEQKTDFGTFTWELRSVNQRYLETFFKLPDNLRNIEGDIREFLRQNLERGKVECTLRYTTSKNSTDGVMNENLAKLLVECAEKVASYASNPDKVIFNPIDILLYPGVMDNNNGDIDEVRTVAIGSFKEAVKQLKIARAREGEKLQTILQDKLNKITHEVEKVKTNLPSVLAWQKDKLLSAFKEAQIDLDPARLEQEMIIIAQRLDVAEELDRLEAHVSETYSILKKGGACGRRLDFMMQEFNRESNTLASKSINADITNSAVELKVFIEQMREQIQNIE